MNRRESILQKLESIFGSDVVKKVVRTRPKKDSFKTFSNSQFPLMALESPAPIFHGQVQEARQTFAKTLKFKFRLPVSILVYDNISGSVDTDFGILYDKIFKLLFLDPQFYGLAKKIEIDPEHHAVVDMSPYYAFRLRLIFTYETTSGI